MPLMQNYTNNAPGMPLMQNYTNNAHGDAFNPLMHNIPKWSDTL